MTDYRVTATSLNMRSTPRVTGTNRIATLSQGQIVKKLNDQDNPWWLVQTTISGVNINGHVHSRYLAKNNDFEDPITFNSIVSVHLEENRLFITRHNNTGRAFPLGEPNRPGRTDSSFEGKAKQIGDIISWLDVESSARYLPSGSTTYCNIYAYDYCYLSGVYIPRVWWKQKSILELSMNNNVSVRYGETVTELNANALHDWLIDFGSNFGWNRIFSIDKAQLAANNGKVVIVCAKRVTTNRPGHICAIVPETGTSKAKRKSDGSISHPLQSQAGSNNYKYKAANMWWTADRFQSFGIWVNE